MSPSACDGDTRGGRRHDGVEHPGSVREGRSDLRGGQRAGRGGSPVGRVGVGRRSRASNLADFGTVQRGRARAGAVPACPRPGVYVPRQTHGCDAAVLMSGGWRCDLTFLRNSSRLRYGSRTSSAGMIRCAQRKTSAKHRPACGGTRAVSAATRGGLPCAVGEPQHEGGVDEADKGGGALDRRPLAGLRVREAALTTRYRVSP